MDRYLACIAFVCAVSVVAPAVLKETRDSLEVSGYYWRDYNGVIPKDALPAGIDRRGKSIYIGQALVDDKIFPGKLFVDDKKLYYEFGEKAWSTTDGVKILCTRHPELFKWVPTTIYDYVELSKSNVLVKGGHEPGFAVYIGRRQEKEETNVGKVVCWETRCLALYTALNGKQVEYHEYEILTYDPVTFNSIDGLTK